MNPVASPPALTLSTLPSNILLKILKLVADSPIPIWHRVPPFPIQFSHISHRIRELTLASPEIWTTIRLSHRTRFWKWAPLFLERSQAQLLDISVNLEAYMSLRQSADGPLWSSGTFTGYTSYSALRPLPIAKALVVIGPHIERWRSLALRCTLGQLEALCSYIKDSALSAVNLEVLHISVIEEEYSHNMQFLKIPSLTDLLAGGVVRSLRIDSGLELQRLSGFRTLSLHLDLVYSPQHSIALRSILGPSSPLQSLIIRRLSFQQGAYFGAPFNACNLTTLAVSFRDYDFGILTQTFNLPNLERLELIHAFSGSDLESESLTLPQEWEAPVFPRLRTLRLVDLELSSTNLAFIQSFSQTATELQLIRVSAAHHILHPICRDHGWPVLFSMTIETHYRDPYPEWLIPFLSARASTRDRKIVKLTVSPHLQSDTLTSACSDCNIELRPLLDGSSPSLYQNSQQSCFFYDEDDLLNLDFEWTESHRRAPVNDDRDLEWEDPYPFPLHADILAYEINLGDDEEEKDGDVAEAFKHGREWRTTKGALREAKREMRRERKLARIVARRRLDCKDDFYVL
ncbi:hypothetical protein R3P38DRAFT_3298654 [Favolaschia claudopus]|uniref:F-box domain-containing protein n=1 Tax=Favolaschia claudopus TaxID=2862362 RepID=A0AAV9Z2H7_9AGAR